MNADGRYTEKNEDALLKIKLLERENESLKLQLKKLLQVTEPGDVNAGELNERVQEVDFDKKNWQEDAAAVMQVCKDHNIPAALERSRSGNGGHIWIFFDTPIDASWARRLGSMILSFTMKRRYQLGLDSYDRLFPNQDTLPKGGFGNLIALPLQGGPRKDGNSVFLDENFVPYEDQWQFLSGLGKMSEEEVSRFIQKNREEGQYSSSLVADHEEDDYQIPWDFNVKSKTEPVEESLPPQISVVL